MSKPSLVVVLAEDQRHHTFVRQYLKCAGYSGHQIRAEPVPAGRGSGEQWVRERYARNVDTYRARAPRAETALVVVIDADTGTVDRRTTQLRELRERYPNERISHLIPKRNIETWILCLSGREVDEEQDYRHENGVEALIKPSAEVFFNWTRPNAAPPAHCVDSLRQAIPEAKKLDA